MTHATIAIRCAWALTLLAAPLFAQEGAPIHVWDLGGMRPGQLTVYNPDSNDAEFGTPVRAGDLNGDGIVNGQDLGLMLADWSD